MNRPTLKYLVLIALVLCLSALLASVVYAGVTSNEHMSDTPDGPSVTQFPSGTTTVYVVFDYTDMQNEEITIKVHSPVGTVLFEQTQAYSGSGTESIEVPAPGGAFPDGRYDTNFYTGVFPYDTLIWDVGEVATPTATTTGTVMTATSTPTATPTNTAMSTSTNTPTDTPTPTPTNTSTSTPTSTLTSIPTSTPTPTPTDTSTPTPTNTPTATPSPTATPTPTETATPTPTPTPLPRVTVSPAEGCVGQEFTFTGSYFTPNGLVHEGFTYPDQGYHYHDSFYTNSSGGFVRTITSEEEWLVGIYIYVAFDLTKDYNAYAQFEIIGPPPTATVTVTATPTVPSSYAVYLPIILKNAGG